MPKFGNKVAAASLAAVLATLPQDEGGVKGGVSKPYLDIGGVPTVCYGHTKNVNMNKIYTQAECNALLKEDTIIHMERVQSCMKREPTQSQLTAFTSFDFNTGAWCSSRSNKEFNLGNDKESCVTLSTAPNGSPAWSYVQGQFIPGLNARRKREEATCSKGLNEKIPDYSGSALYSLDWNVGLSQCPNG